MFLKPTIPNLTDYLSFLANTVGIPDNGVMPTLQGTASGGDNQRLEDTSQTWDLNQYSGYTLLDASQNVIATIASNDLTNAFLTEPLANPILNGDDYQIAIGYIYSTLQLAQATVNEAINAVSPMLYVLAVYNLAADRLINYAMDVKGQSYFADVRKALSINTVSVGVASSANDAGTSVGILNPEQMKLLTMQNLQQLKTPYGREYMGIAQAYGRTAWVLA